MTDHRRPSRILTALAAVTVLAAVAAPALGADDVAVQADDLEETAGTVEDEVASAEEEVADEEPSAADEVAAALSAVGDAVAAAAGAVASGVADAAGALASGIAAIGSALASGVAAVGSALAAAASWTGSAIASGAVAVATGLASAVGAVADATVAAVAATASGVATAAVALAAALHDLALAAGAAWPSEPARQAAVAGTAGTAGTAAAGGAAWYTRAWRYLRYAPGLAPLYSRIDRDELLEHPKRKAIHEAIQQEPGIHLSELQRRLDLSWGTLMHHLRKLEKADLVTSEDSSGKRCFFLPGQATGAEREILPALENETARDIAEFYIENPGASQSEAVEALDHSAALVSWHLGKLEEAGVVEREREGRCQRVGVTQEAKAVVAA